MTAAALVAFGAVALGCVALWHPMIERWVLGRPWWLQVSAPSAALAIVAILAALVPSKPPSGVGEVASVLAVLVAVTGGGPVTVGLLRGAERSGVHGVADVADLAQLDQQVTAPPADEVLRGGTWIGVLERAAIAASLLVGLAEGVAITIAIKGLARYPELRVVGASERFIIGTFSSALWAAAAAGVAVLVRS